MRKKIYTWRCAEMLDLNHSQIKKAGWINFLLFTLVLFSSVTCHAGFVLEYQGIDWMAKEADDIVITSKVSEPKPVEHYRAGGAPVISGFPEIANGVKTKVTVYKVLKGQLSAGESIEIFMPFTGDCGKYPREFPMASAAGPFENQFTIMFIKRTKNQILLETLPCFGSTIIVNPVKLLNFVPASCLNNTILNLIEKQPCLQNRNIFPSGDNFNFGNNLATYTSGTAN